MKNSLIFAWHNSGTICTALKVSLNAHPISDFAGKKLDTLLQVLL